MPATTLPSMLARKRRLGELLIEAGVLDDLQLKTALAEQRKWGGKLGRVLVEMHFIDEITMGRVLAQQLNLETIDLDTAKLPERIVDHLRLDFAERYGVFPVRADPTGKILYLATPDPTNNEMLNELEFGLGVRVIPVVATESAIERAVRRYYFGEQTSATMATTPQALGVQSEPVYELEQQFEGGPPPSTSLNSNAPVVRKSAPRPMPPQPPGVVEAELRAELAVLREQVVALEQSNTSQVRALRSLLELLMEAGLVGRDEYLWKLHRPEQ